MIVIARNWVLESFLESIMGAFTEDPPWQPLPPFVKAAEPTVTVRKASRSWVFDKCKFNRGEEKM